MASDADDNAALITAGKNTSLVGYGESSSSSLGNNDDDSSTGVRTRSTTQAEAAVAHEESIFTERIPETGSSKQQQQQLVQQQQNQPQWRRSRSRSRHPTVKQIESYIFHHYVHRILRSHGWTCKTTPRPPPDSNASSKGPREDLLYVPPGVRPHLPYKKRVDYFDSRSQMLQFLQSKWEENKEGKGNDNDHGVSKTAQIILSFLDVLDDVLRNKKAHLNYYYDEEGSENDTDDSDRHTPNTSEGGTYPNEEKNLKDVSEYVINFVQEQMLLKQIQWDIEHFHLSSSFSSKKAEVPGTTGVKDGNSKDSGPDRDVSSLNEDETMLLNQVKAKILQDATPSADDVAAAVDGITRPVTPPPLTITLPQTTSLVDSFSTPTPPVTVGSAVVAISPPSQQEKRLVIMRRGDVTEHKKTESADIRYNIFVQVTKKLPKYVANTTRQIFTAETIQRKILDKVLQDPSTSKTKKKKKKTGDGGEVLSPLSSPPPPPTRATRMSDLLRISIVDTIPDDPHSILLKVFGRKDYVTKAKHRIENMIREEMYYYNTKAIVTDPSSLEIDFIFDLSSSMGAGLGESPLFDKDLVGVRSGSSTTGGNSSGGAPGSEGRGGRNFAGLWITNVQPNGQLYRYLGGSNGKAPAFMHGAVVLSVNNVHVYRLNDLRTLIEKAKNEGATDNTTSNKGTMVVTICVSKYADLSTVDKSRVLPEGKCPRMRDGSVYRGKWKLYDDDGTPTGFGSIAMEPALSQTPNISRLDRLDDNAGGDQKQLPSTSSDRIKTSTMESGVASNVATGDKAKNREKGTSGKASTTQSYITCGHKYRKVRDIEYANYGINGQFVRKKMWERHKVLLGDSCDDNCACPSRLAELTENVVRDYMRREVEKDPKWNNPFGLKLGDSPVGFVNHFVPKFYPRVKNEFPTDNPAQVLTKLVSMWSEHMKERRFGITCNKDCPCLEGWELIFLDRCLRPKKVDRMSNQPPELSRGKSWPGPTSVGERRGIATEGTGAVGLTNLNRSTSGPAKTGVLLKSDTLKRQTQKEYALTFDPLAPLDFFCVTEKDPKGTGTVCKIRSVCPRAKKKDNRLQTGTIVVATAFVLGTVPLGTKTPISSHDELRQTYDAAKMKRGSTRLRLWFVNSDVVSSGAGVPSEGSAMIPSLSSRDSDWTSTGAWQGQSDVPGWAGGAPVIQKRSERPPQAYSRETKSLKYTGKRQAVALESMGTTERSVKRSRTTSSSVHDPSTSEMGVVTSKGGNKSDLTSSMQRKSQPALKHFPSHHDSSSSAASKGIARPTSLKSADIARDGPGQPRKSGETEQLASTRGDFAPLSKTPPSQNTGTLPMAVSAASEEHPMSQGVGKVVQGSVPSILRKGREKGSDGARKVTFSRKLVETRFFNMDGSDIHSSFIEQDEVAPPPAPAVDSLIPEGGDSTGGNSTEDDLPGIDQLTHATLNRDFKEVLRLLKKGACANQKDSRNKRPLDYAKEKLDELSREEQNPRSNKAEIRLITKDFQLKQNLLKIYIQAQYLIEMARFMKKWVNVELTVEKAKNVHLSDLGKAHRSTDFLFCTVEIEGIKQENVPLVPFTSNPDWTPVSNRPTYTLRYNGDLEFTFRRGLRVVVNLIKGNSPSPGENINVGSWEATKEQIKSCIDSFGSREIEHELKKTPYLSGGSMTVKIRRIPLGQDFIQRKRIEIAGELVKLIGWIDAFNREVKSFSHDEKALSCDISLPNDGNLSLLHAAVYVADLNLVNRLLALGANPNIKSVVGSPINLAGNMADKTDLIANEGIHGTLIDIRNALMKKSREVDSEKSETKGRDDASHVDRLNQVRDYTHEESSRSGSLNKRRVDIMDQQHAFGQDKSQGSASDLNDQNAVLELAEKAKTILQNHSHFPDSSAPQSIYGVQPNSGSYHHFYPTSGQDLAPQAFMHGYPVAYTSNSTAGNTAGYASFYTPSSAASDKSVSSDLPQLPQIDWLEGKSKRCIHFNKGACRNGVGCSFAHVCLPLGAVLDDESWMGREPRKLSRAHIRTKQGTNSAGQLFFTAAYLDPAENIIYYAERGRTGRQSNQGVYWYPSEDDAISAVERVVEQGTDQCQSPPMATSTAHDNSGLPLLPSVDWLKGRSQRCTFFNKSGGCSFGKKCSKTHVHPPVGSILDDDSTEGVSVRLRQKHFHTKREHDASGRAVYTAAYLHPAENIVYYAERGPEAQQSTQGVYWYPSEESAIAATRNVVKHGMAGEEKHCDGKREISPALNPHVGAEPPRKKVKREGGKKVLGEKGEENEVFEMLLKSNMANIYSQMFRGHAMKKTYWTTARKGDLVTAEYRSALDHDKDTVYVPRENGGKYLSRRWWYEDERLAKASTMLQIMKQAVRTGALKDLRTTSSGKPIAFKK